MRPPAREIEACHLEWRVDCDAGIFVQDMVEPGRMVVVAMAEHDEIESLQIDPDGVGIVRKI